MHLTNIMLSGTDLWDRSQDSRCWGMRGGGHGTDRAPFLDLGGYRSVLALASIFTYDLWTSLPYTTFLKAYLKNTGESVALISRNSFPCQSEVLPTPSDCNTPGNNGISFSGWLIFIKERCTWWLILYSQFQCCLGLYCQCELWYCSQRDPEFRVLK